MSLSSTPNYRWWSTISRGVPFMMYLKAFFHVDGPNCMIAHFLMLNVDPGDTSVFKSLCSCSLFTKVRVYIDDLVICEYSNNWSDVVSSSPTWTASKVHFKSKDCITLQTFNCKLFVLFSIRFTLNQVNFIISDNIV